jgi:hypothetical protein
MLPRYEEKSERAPSVARWRLFAHCAAVAARGNDAKDWSVSRLRAVVERERALSGERVLRRHGAEARAQGKHTEASRGRASSHQCL